MELPSDWAVLAHVVAAVVAAAGALGIGALGAWAASGHPVRLGTLDRLILVVIGSVLVAIALGPLLLAGGRGLADPLHALYGVIALLATPVARGAAMRDEDPARRQGRNRSVSPALGRWALVGALVTFGALVRLATTGG